MKSKGQIILIGTRKWSSYDVYVKDGVYYIYCLGSDGVPAEVGTNVHQAELIKTFKKYNNVLNFLKDNSDAIFEGNFERGFTKLEFRA